MPLSLAQMGPHISVSAKSWKTAGNWFSPKPKIPTLTWCFSWFLWGINIKDNVMVRTWLRSSGIGIGYYDKSGDLITTRAFDNLSISATNWNFMSHQQRNSVFFKKSIISLKQPVWAVTVSRRRGVFAHSICMPPSPVSLLPAFALAPLGTIHIWRPQWERGGGHP